MIVSYMVAKGIITELRDYCSFSCLDKRGRNTDGVLENYILLRVDSHNCSKHELFEKILLIVKNYKKSNEINDYKYEKHNHISLYRTDCYGKYMFLMIDL